MLRLCHVFKGPLKRNMRHLKLVLVVLLCHSKVAMCLIMSFQLVKEINSNILEALFIKGNYKDPPLPLRLLPKTNELLL